ncbi:hypothetical protein QVD99_002513 [Batrachochytrium dendrobatidis]|nr:hypothetical protein QVD99_002513 [Batrachochytrium dendrobatidis]
MAPSHRTTRDINAIAKDLNDKLGFKLPVQPSNTQKFGYKHTFKTETTQPPVLSLDSHLNTHDTDYSNFITKDSRTNDSLKQYHFSQLNELPKSSHFNQEVDTKKAIQPTYRQLLRRSTLNTSPIHSVEPKQSNSFKKIEKTASSKQESDESHGFKTNPFLKLNVTQGDNESFNNATLYDSLNTRKSTLQTHAIRHIQPQQNKFGKASTGRLPIDLATTERKQQQNEAFLNVVLIGQRVKTLPENQTNESAVDEFSMPIAPDNEYNAIDDFILEVDESLDEFQTSKTNQQMLESTFTHQRNGLVCLSPVIVPDNEAYDSDDDSENQKNKSAALQEPDSFEFSNIDDVDQIGNRYASILENRIRKLRGEDVPSVIPLTPMEIKSHEPNASILTAPSLPTCQAEGFPVETIIIEPTSSVTKSDLKPNLELNMEPIEVSYRISSALLEPKTTGSTTEFETLNLSILEQASAPLLESETLVKSSRPKLSIIPEPLCESAKKVNFLNADAKRQPSARSSLAPIQHSDSIPNEPAVLCRGYWKSALPLMKHSASPKPSPKTALFSLDSTVGETPRKLTPNTESTTSGKSTADIKAYRPGTDTSSQYQSYMTVETMSDTADSREFETFSPNANNHDLMSPNSLMFQHEEEITDWQDGMIVKSLKLISENKSKCEIEPKLPLKYTFPFAEYATPEPHLKDYRPYFPVNNAGLDHKLPSKDETKGDILNGKHHRINAHMSKSNRLEESSNTKNAYAFQKNDSCAFDLVNTEAIKQDFMQKDQPSSEPSSKEPFSLKIDGSRMYLEMGTLGRGSAIIGASPVPINSALSIPAFGLHPYHKAKVVAPRNALLPKTKESISKPNTLSTHDLEAILSNKRTSAVFSVNPVSLVSNDLNTPDTPNDDLGLNIEEYKREPEMYNQKLNVSVDMATDTLTTQATSAWISTDQLVIPTPFDIPPAKVEIQNSIQDSTHKINEQFLSNSISLAQSNNDTQLHSARISQKVFEKPTDQIMPQDVSVALDCKSESINTPSDLHKNSSTDNISEQQKTDFESDQDEQIKSLALSQVDFDDSDMEILSEKSEDDENKDTVDLKQKRVQIKPAESHELSRPRVSIKKGFKKSMVLFASRAGSSNTKRYSSCAAIKLIESQTAKVNEVAYSSRSASAHARSLSTQQTGLSSEVLKKQHSRQAFVSDTADPSAYYNMQVKKASGLGLNRVENDGMGTRPVIGVSLIPSHTEQRKPSVSSKQYADSVKSEPKSNMVSENNDEVDSATLANRKLLQQALQINGFVRGLGQSVYQVVHDPERRLSGLNAIERSRYPTFDDPGPPLDATGMPIVNADGGLPSSQSIEDILSDVERLDKIILQSTVPVPTFYRKRATLLARLGRFTTAMDDLDKAIQYDQFNSDAYWHRHQLFLRINDVEKALCDLDIITDNNKMHYGAFQTKARIYQALGMIKPAIVNYSAVIRLKPDDPDGYYNRACLFEAENEMVYANEDFRMVRTLDPSNSHAIYNLAIYSFQKQLWEDSIQAFTKLIGLNPENSQAYMYRGRANAAVARYDEALDDLSTAIRINPTRAQYFFHRGCLLRSRNPTRAIQDLSVSILLDDSSANNDAFYQRAKVYQTIGKYDLSISDYTSVIDLDSTKSKAYLNLGILHMRHYAEYRKALYSFSKSIANDPINLQTYLCRGELYQLLQAEALPELPNRQILGKPRLSRLGNRDNPSISYISKAIQDYSRAIHLCPSNYLLFLYRGRLLLKQGLMAEATTDFHAAFDLNSNIAQTFIQRALVLCFQRKYKQVIDEFDEKKKTQMVDDPALLLLIAKARIQCGDFKGALRDLTSALDYSQNDPQTFLQRGICFEHLQDWSAASAEFTKCITYMPTYAKAYYHRGLCKLYEKNDTGVNDLDLAIQYDEKFFEAYLTRASFHHSKGMYTRGIEDCNEALKLEPTSIRSHLLRGACKCKLNQFGLAIADFTRATIIDKSSHFAFYNRAITYQLLNDLDNAIKDYSIVLLLRDDSNAYRNRALIYWKKGDHQNALQDLHAARNYYPQDAKLRGLFGLCLHKVSQNQESIDEFTKALELSPFMYEALLGRGNVHASMNNLKLARQDYSKVIHMFPLCAEAYVNIAYTMQTEGRPQESWNFFSTALKIDPQCTAALEGRSIMHLTMKNAFAALVDITKAIEISPTNPEFLTNRGVIFEAMKDNTSALQSYKAAILADPNYGLAHFNAANLYIQQKLWEQAIFYFNKALIINSKDKAALLNRSICKLMLKDTDGALNDLDLAAEIDPDSPHVHFNRGHLFQSLGKYVLAEKEYTKVVELLPRDSVAYMHRGKARGSQSKWPDAMDDYSMAIAAEDE